MFEKCEEDGLFSVFRRSTIQVISSLSGHLGRGFSDISIAKTFLNVIGGLKSMNRIKIMSSKCILFSLICKCVMRIVVCKDVKSC